MNYPLFVVIAYLITKILISSSFSFKRPLSQSETAIYCLTNPASLNWLKRDSFPACLSNFYQGVIDEDTCFPLVVSLFACWYHGRGNFAYWDDRSIVASVQHTRVPCALCSSYLSLRIVLYIGSEFWRLTVIKIRFFVCSFWYMGNTNFVHKGTEIYDTWCL